MVSKYITQERIDELKKRPWAKVNPEAIKNLEKGLCATCNAPIKGFKDDLSLKEYQISGMCNECQDKVFGGPE